MEGGALITDPHNEEILWMGGKYHDSGNYYMSVSVSRNNGASWSRHHLVQANGTVYAIAIDPIDSDIVYAGGYPGLFKTTNGGVAWEEISGVIGDTIYALAIVPDTPTILYAGTPSGIFKSLNSGSSWTNTGCSGVLALTISSPDHDTVYAGTRSGVYKSCIGNETWVAMNQGLDNTHVLSLAIAPGHFLYAGTRGNGIYRWSLSAGNNDDAELRKPDRVHMYPNPVKEVCTIRYTLEHSADVVVALYDSQGRRVKLFVDERQSPGTHQLIFDLGSDDMGLPYGIYFFQLLVGNQSYQQKVILFK